MAKNTKKEFEDFLFKQDWRWALCWTGRESIGIEGLDCACCLLGKDIKGCKCICHKRINKLWSFIKKN